MQELHRQVDAPVNILLVDDEVNNLFSLQKILVPLKENLFKATSGKEALKEILLREFAVILLDVRMPVMDGFEVAELIRKRKGTEDTSIIFITGYDQDDAGVFKGYEKGAVDYLVKPVKADILLSKTRVFVELYKKKQEIKRQRERSRSIIANSMHACISMNEAGEVTDWNPSAESIFGWPASMAIGNKVSDLIMPAKYHRLHTEGLRNFLDTGEGPILNKIIELSAVRKDGTEFPIELSIRPIDLPDGFIFSAFISDISERKKLELEVLSAKNNLESLVEQRTAELERKTSEAERRTSEMEQFAYIASHDLQEPLRMISSYCELFREEFDGTLTDKGRQYLGFAVDGAERMKCLIDDLLEYSRIGMRLEEVAKPVDMNLALSDALRNLSILVEETDAKIDRVELPVLSGNRPALSRLFQNIISNAIKYRNPSEAPRLSVNVKDSANEYVFSIADNGIGIEKEHFERIFVIFQRLHSRAEHPGTGIGLAICKKIIEAHNGRIWLESKEGVGTTFFFTLPKLASDGGA